MPLTDTAIRTAKPADKPRKMADEKGLYLLLQPMGGKLWRFDYRFEGKRKTLALGSYPDVPLARAREKRDEARRLLADGVDPSENRKVQAAAKVALAANSFEVVAREWFAKMKPEWVTSRLCALVHCAHPCISRTPEFRGPAAVCERLGIYGPQVGISRDYPFVRVSVPPGYRSPILRPACG